MDKATVTTWRADFRYANRARWYLAGVVVLVVAIFGPIVSAGLDLDQLGMPTSLGGWAFFGASTVALTAILKVALDKRRPLPLNLFCTQCGKHIPSNIPWTCGYCDFANDGRRWSFLTECEKCDASPGAYTCHHCGAHNFLSSKRDARHAATATLSPRAGEPAAETRARLQREREITEDTTRLTLAQTQLLKAEAQHILQKRHKEALEQQGKTIDPVTRMAQELEAAIGAALNNVTTQKQLREIIVSELAKLENSLEFQALDDERRTRVREMANTIADDLEQRVRKAL